MEKSLWSVDFHSHDLSFGSGIVTFIENTVVGGDLSFYYVGTYSESNDELSAAVTITQFSPGISVFGQLKECTVIITGKRENSKISFSGYVDQRPELEVVAYMEKLTNI